MMPPSEAAKGSRGWRGVFGLLWPLLVVAMGEGLVLAIGLAVRGLEGGLGGVWFDLNDTRLRHPKLEVNTPFVYVWLISYLFPLFFFPLYEYFYWSHIRDCGARWSLPQRGASGKVWLVSAVAHTTACWSANALSQFLVEVLKSLFRAPRPDFLHRCLGQEAGRDAFEAVANGTSLLFREAHMGWLTADRCPSVADEHGKSLTIQGLRSFPSGHTAQAVSFSSYLTLFLLYRLVWRKHLFRADRWDRSKPRLTDGGTYYPSLLSQGLQWFRGSRATQPPSVVRHGMVPYFWEFLLASAPMLYGFKVGAEKFKEGRHHPGDIVAGTAVGFLMALVAVRSVIADTSCPQQPGGPAEDLGGRSPPAPVSECQAQQPPGGPDVGMAWGGQGSTDGLLASRLPINNSPVGEQPHLPHPPHPPQPSPDCGGPQGKNWGAVGGAWEGKPPQTQPFTTTPEAAG